MSLKPIFILNGFLRYTYSFIVYTNIIFSRFQKSLLCSNNIDNTLTHNRLYSFSTFAKPLNMSNCTFKPLNLTTKGNLGEKDFKIFFSDSAGNPVSPWHFDHQSDFSLTDEFGNKVFPMVLEIPKNQYEKLEVDTKTVKNPIKQDLKNDQVRLYPKPNPFNYGAMPRTWEDPEESLEEAGVIYFGDNDPLDLVEISPTPFKCGQILTVKVLGALGLIDQDEMDWKIVVLSTENENYKNINNMEDANKFYPGVGDAIIDWYKTYKVPNNKYIRNEQYLSVEETIDLIHHYNKIYETKRWLNNNLV